MVFIYLFYTTKFTLFNVIFSTIINIGAAEASLYLEEAINIALQVLSFYLPHKSTFFFFDNPL